MSELKPWQQCTALITGGQGCLGSAIAAALRERGVTVYTTARQSTGEHVLVWDMQDPDSTNQLLQTIKARQLSIDLLVHCAHVFSEAKLILQVSPSAFHSSLVTNLVPLYELMRGVSRSMYRQRFGRILLMGSLISVYGGAGKIRYIVEKSAFDGLAQGFSAEYSSAGVTTCVLHPSLIDTDTIRERVDAELLQQVAAASAGGRLLSVAEVAAASLTLIDPTQALNSGQLVELSGGARW